MCLKTITNAVYTQNLYINLGIIWNIISSFIHMKVNSDIKSTSGPMVVLQVVSTVHFALTIKRCANLWHSIQKTNHKAIIDYKWHKSKNFKSADVRTSTISYDVHHIHRLRTDSGCLCIVKPRLWAKPPPKIIFKIQWSIMLTSCYQQLVILTINFYSFVT